jgi:hypothetical protein
MLSSFMGWYAGSQEGPTIAVIGWHTGVIGKLVFLIGLAVVVLVVLRELGIELPATIPESLVIIVLGALATILVLIRNRRRQLDPQLAEDDEDDHGEPDQEHELADDARVPADHGDRGALLRAGVPPHERRENEHEPGEGGDALAHRPDPPGERQEGIPIRRMLW